MLKNWTPLFVLAAFTLTGCETTVTPPAPTTVVTNTRPNIARAEPTPVSSGLPSQSAGFEPTRVRPNETGAR